MHTSSRVNAADILQRALARSHGEGALIAERIQRDLSRFLRYRVAGLEAALRRVEELRRAAAQGI